MALQWHDYTGPDYAPRQPRHDKIVAGATGKTFVYGIIDSDNISGFTLTTMFGSIELGCFYFPTVDECKQKAEELEES